MTVSFCAARLPSTLLRPLRPRPPWEGGREGGSEPRGRLPPSLPPPQLQLQEAVKPRGWGEWGAGFPGASGLESLPVP